MDKSFIIQRRLKPHDANQLQLKLAYTVDRRVKKQRYLVESFMFVSRTLGVGGHSYEPERFYEDTQTFIRLKTPIVALEALASSDRAGRWFSVLDEDVPRLLAGEDVDLDTVIRGLKILGSIYHSALRDEGRMLRDLFDGLELTGRQADGTRGQESELARRLERFADHLEGALRRLRDAGSRCDHAATPEDLRVVWEVVDEYIALYAERVLTRIVADCDARLDGRDDGVLYTVRNRLAAVAVAHYHHRVARGYGSVIVVGEPNEGLPRRRRLLRRVIQSALFLDTPHETGGLVAGDLVAGLAAAIAMLFAALIAIWAQGEWGALSSTFVVVAVLSYIVKDRLKEWGKRYFGKHMKRRVPDYVVKVRDPQTLAAIGEVRESVNVFDAEQVDPEVLALRHAGHPSAPARHGRNEVVIRFQKEVTLRSDGLQRALGGVDGLNDIIRFNFARFRQRMDRAIETHPIVHPTTHEIVEVPCNRVYHISLVLRISSGPRGDASSTVEHVRVVLDHDGIRRVEATSPRPRTAADRVVGRVRARTGRRSRVRTLRST